MVLGVLTIGVLENESTYPKFTFNAPAVASPSLRRPTSFVES